MVNERQQALEKEAQALLDRGNSDPGMPEHQWRVLELSLLQNYHDRLVRLETGSFPASEAITKPQPRLTPPPFDAVKGIAGRVDAELAKGREPK
jgi:hypothetical protein